MEGPSKPDTLFLARPFVLGTRLILAYPVATIAISLGLAAVALLPDVPPGSAIRPAAWTCSIPRATTTGCGSSTSRSSATKTTRSSWSREQAREQVVPVLEEISAALAREDRLFHAVLHEVDLGKIRSKGLHYLSPEELLGIDQFLNEVSARFWPAIGRR